MGSGSALPPVAVAEAAEAAASSQAVSIQSCLVITYCSHCCQMCVRQSQLHHFQKEAPSPRARVPRAAPFKAWRENAGLLSTGVAALFPPYPRSCGPYLHNSALHGGPASLRDSSAMSMATPNAQAPPLGPLCSHQEPTVLADVNGR